jgi:capsular exopolysaccharide synthesis family protein
VEVRDVAASAWRHKFIVVVVLLATVGLAVAFAATRNKEYESTAVLALTPKVQGGVIALGDQLDSLLKTYAGVANSAVVIDAAEERLGRPLDGEILTSTESGSGILYITARASDPDRAAQNANAVAERVGDNIPRDGLLESRVVSPAKENDDPVGPALALVTGVAFALGLALALATAVALDHFRRRVQSAEDVRTLTDAPVLVHQPYDRRVSKLGRRQSIWDIDEHAPFMESMRVLRLNLLQRARELEPTDRRRIVARVGGNKSHEPRGNAVIQITSATPRQGKSVTTACLGLSCARAGLRTLVLDANVHRPCQHDLIDVDNSKGFSDLLWEEESPQSLVASTEHENLFVLPCGSEVSRAVDRLQLRLESIFGALRDEYEVILVDTPPVLSSTASRSVVQFADGVIMVTAAGDEPPAVLENAISDLNLLRSPVLGVALNRVKQSETAVVGGYNK